jgi:hypothetical protein
MIDSCETLAKHAEHWRDMVDHTATLSALAADARVIVEMGVRGGVSTWALLDGLPADGRLVSCDNAKVRQLLPGRVTRDPRWTLLIADDLLAQFPPADLVFIDTTHEFEHTLAELRIADRLGAQVIALHDCHADPVAGAIALFNLDRAWSVTVEPSAWGLAVLRR